jgi:hypothetical protein
VVANDGVLEPVGLASLMVDGEADLGDRGGERETRDEAGNLM